MHRVGGGSRKISKSLWSYGETLCCWKRLEWSKSHLRTASHLTTLMSFFAVTATLELQIQAPYSECLLIGYVVSTSLLVGLTILIKMGADSIVPHIEAVLEGGNNVMESPHDQVFDQILLICCAGNTLAPILFLTDLVLITWIKFARYSMFGSAVATAILGSAAVGTLVTGRVMLRRMLRYREEFKRHMVPTRRYSEIAEEWDEEDWDEEDSLMSYQSNTSYGAVLLRETTALGSVKVLADML